MATRQPPSSSNSSTTASPPRVSEPKVSGTPAPINPSNSSSPPPQSPPLAVSTPPPPRLSPPPAATPPPTSPPPSPPPSPPSPPAGSLPVASPPPPLVSSPPPPSQVLPPKSSPPPPAAALPPASPLPKAPSPPSANSPPPPLDKPPQNSPPPPPSDSPPALQSPQSSPSPLFSNSPPSEPSSSSQSPIPPLGAPSNSSVNGTTPMTPVPFLPSENPTAKSATSGPDMANRAPKGSSGYMSPGMGVAIGIVVGFLALSLIVMAVWFTRKRKRRGAGLDGGYGMPSPFASSQNSGSSFLRPQKSAHLAGSGSGSNFMYSPESGGVCNSRSWFTYDELANATDRFSTHNLLGEGGFGCVYKGCLLDGREVAVKQLKIGGGQGEREFRAEVEIISRVHHRHLVTLVGCCISEHQRLLVYEYVPNNTLHYHLHGEGRPVMQWETRVKVAAGAARGIAYLHEDCHPRIIHRDIKSTNILLDNSFEAWVADFGLAKLALDANTHVTTRVMGTFGYMAPEYASSGKLTEKSDVFSFGVVLLELITGRKPVDASQPLGDESLVEWARPLLSQALESEKFEELIDPRLEKKYVETEMFRMIEAAAVCIRHLASKRPRMSQVVRALGSITDLSDITNGMKPGQSEIFNSREQSAQIRMFQRMAFGSQDCSSEFFDRSQSSWMSRD